VKKTEDKEYFIFTLKKKTNRKPVATCKFISHSKFPVSGNYWMRIDYFITNPRCLNYGNNVTLLIDRRILYWMWRG